MVANITRNIEISSNGVWEGVNPLEYAFPLLIVQTTLIIFVTRFFAFLVKPLRQPRVIAEILGGIILGPSALGRNQEYMHRIFPKWSIPILESVSSIGLLFFLFLVGLELDLSSITGSGKKALAIAGAGISLPFILSIGIASIFRTVINDDENRVGFIQYAVFMGVSLSITAFPVLARILAELNLLNSRVGETAMAAAAFNDVVAWMLLALAIALAESGSGGGSSSPLNSIWVLLCGVAFVAFMILVVKKVMNWVSKNQNGSTVDEAYICFTLSGVMISGFVTDLIGIHAIFGGFIFGLIIPKEGQFASRLIERIEDFVSGLLLPLYFASSGLKTDIAKIDSVGSWGLLALVITAACSGKIIGTFIVAVLCKIPAREALTLGFLMNTKGLVELIVLNIGKEKKVLNDEAFAILVLMALFTTFITTPTVMTIYRSRSDKLAYSKPKLQSNHWEVTNKDETRILACVHAPTNILSVINLIESIRATSNLSNLKLYIMHLIELTERPSSIMLVQRLRKNGIPVINRLCGGLGGSFYDRVLDISFKSDTQLGRVTVRNKTAVSPLSTMHEDICQMVQKKDVTVIILPFHKQWRVINGNEEIMENLGHVWRGVNQRVLMHAPCSVGVLVNREVLFDGGETKKGVLDVNIDCVKRVCVIFFGGANDRVALNLAWRMAQHPTLKVTLIRFVEKEDLQSCDHKLRQSPPNFKEKELDDVTICEFRQKIEGIVEYMENVSGNIVESVLTIGRSGYELVVVGKGGWPPSMAATTDEREVEHAELGSIGDLLASSGQGIISSVLVVQEHGNNNHAQDFCGSRMTRNDEYASANEPSNVV